MWWECKIQPPLLPLLPPMPLAGLMGKPAETSQGMVSSDPLPNLHLLSCRKHEELRVHHRFFQALDGWFYLPSSPVCFVLFFIVTMGTELLCLRSAEDRSSKLLGPGATCTFAVLSSTIAMSKEMETR